MGRNPLTNPLHYATPQLLTGPPVTYASAARTLVNYDYGMSQMLKTCSRVSCLTCLLIEK